MWIVWILIDWICFLFMDCCLTLNCCEILLFEKCKFLIGNRLLDFDGITANGFVGKLVLGQNLAYSCSFSHYCVVLFWLKTSTYLEDDYFGLLCDGKCGHEIVYAIVKSIRFPVQAEKCSIYVEHIYVWISLFRKTHGLEMVNMIVLSFKDAIQLEQ